MPDLVSLDSLPYPVAHPLHWARDAGGALSLSDRIDNAIFAGYQALRLAALLMLADYLKAEPIHPPLAAPIRRLGNAHWADWMALADDLARFWTGGGGAPPPCFGDLARGWMSVNRTRPAGAKRAPLEPEWQALTLPFKTRIDPKRHQEHNSAANTLQIYRNDRAHRLGSRTPDDHPDQVIHLDIVLALVEAVVKKLYSGASYGLWRRVDTPSGWQMIPLTGPHPDARFQPRPLDPEIADALAETEVAAVAPDWEPLPIYPLFVPLDEARGDALMPDSLFDPVAMLDSVVEARLSVLGVKKSHSFSSGHPHLLKTLQALKRKRANIGERTREETAPWSVLAWSRMTARLVLQDLAGVKYFPEFHTRRAGIDDVLDRLREPSPRGKALLLLGEAGSGKSGLLLTLASHLLEEETHPESASRVARRDEDSEDIIVLVAGPSDWTIGEAGHALLTGAAEGSQARIDSLDAMLCEVVARKLNVMAGHRELNTQGGFASVADLLDHLAARAPADQVTGRKIWLLLDAVNEAPGFVDMVNALDLLLGRVPHYPNLRLVMSIRTGAFDSLMARRQERLAAGGDYPFTNASVLMAFPDERGEMRPWLTVRPFSAEEGKAAYQLRQTAAGLRAAAISYAELERQTGLRDLLFRPLYLHLFHETFAGVARLPAGLDEGRLLDGYLDQVTDRGGGIAGADGLLDQLARTMLDQARGFLPLAAADAMTAAWNKRALENPVLLAARLGPVETLVAASVLLRPAEDGTGVDRELKGYTFAHQKLAERVLLRHMDRSLGGRTLPERQDILAWANREPFPELTAAITDWLGRLVTAADSESIATLGAVLAVTDPAIGDPLVSAVIVALSRIGDERVRAIMAGLVAEATKQGDARNRLLRPALTAANRLDLTARIEVRRAVWEELSSLAEKLAETNPANREDLYSLLFSYGKLGDIALQQNNAGAAEKYFHHRGMINVEKLIDRYDYYNDILKYTRRDVNKLMENVKNDDQELYYIKDKCRELISIVANIQVQQLLYEFYTRIGYLALNRDNLSFAADNFYRALITNPAFSTDTTDKEAIRNLCILHKSLGYIDERYANYDRAKIRYNEALKIAQELAADSDDKQAQRDLATAYTSLGDLAVSVDDFSGAEAYLREGLKIRRELARDTDDKQAQRDLATAYTSLGDLAVSVDDFSGAEAYLHEGLKIRRELASDTDDKQAQRDLWASYLRLSELAHIIGDYVKENEWLCKSMEILAKDKYDNPDVIQDEIPSFFRFATRKRNAANEAKLAAAEAELAENEAKLAANEAELAENKAKLAANEAELAENKAKLAANEAELAENKAKLAEIYREAAAYAITISNHFQSVSDSIQARLLLAELHDMCEMFIADEITDFRTQHDISVFFDRMGDLAQRVGDKAKAAEYFGKGLKIDQKAVERDPDNPGSLRDLTVSYDRLGDLARDAGDIAEARRLFQEGLVIREAQHEAAPSDIKAADDLAVSCCKMSSVTGQRDETTAWLEKGRAVLAAFIADGRADKHMRQVDAWLADELAKP